MNKPRDASVVCMTGVETLWVDARDFLKVVHKHPEFMRMIFNEILGKLHRSRIPGAKPGSDFGGSVLIHSRELGADAMLQILVQRQQDRRRACWHSIGVWGDGSCPELSQAIHCRNCPVFATAGRSLLERQQPSDYVEQWTKALAQPKETLQTDTQAVVVFRLGEEWLAFRAAIFHEITTSRSIHALPHLTNDVLLGLVNVRGELLPCFSLTRLLGVANTNGAEHAMSRRIYARFAVTEHDGNRWVFPVDEVFGIHELLKSSMQNTPVTVARARTSFAAGMFVCQQRPVELLDDELVFYHLKKKYL
jgi:chemotaxis-related protein WspD